MPSTDKRRVVAHQPLPNKAAKRALHHISHLKVEFDGKVSGAEESAVFDYLDDLVEWWRLPCVEWRTGVKSP